MLEKLRAAAARYDALQAQLSDPSVYGDAERLRDVNRELKELGPVVEAFSAWEQAGDRLRETEALLKDPDLRAMAQEELPALRAETERLSACLKTAFDNDPELC